MVYLYHVLVVLVAIHCLVKLAQDEWRVVVLLGSVVFLKVARPPLQFLFHVFVVLFWNEGPVLGCVYCERSQGC